MMLTKNLEMTNNGFNCLFILYLLLPLCSAQGLSIQITNTKKLKANVYLKLIFTLAPDELILKESLRFSTDSPDLLLKSWKTKQETVPHYLSSIKNNKRMYTHSFTMLVKLSKTTKKPLVDPCHLHISCFKHVEQKTTPISCILAIG